MNFLGLRRPPNSRKGEGCDRANNQTLSHIRDSEAQPEPMRLFGTCSDLFAIIEKLSSRQIYAPFVRYIHTCPIPPPDAMQPYLTPGKAET